MIIAAILLLSLGTTVIFSSSSDLAMQQAFFGFLGLISYYGLRSFDYRTLKSLIKPLYILVMVLLVIVFILDIETRGSSRWIPLGFFNFQPSELAKISIILALAHFWSGRIPSWKNIGLSALILAPPALMVFRQPDLGTALTIGFIWISLFLAANVSFVKVAILFITSLISLPLSWNFLKDYQRDRIISFIYPSHDPLGVGYNVIQSTIAVGSGGLFGRGLGRGTQSRLQFLPESRTDFIFAFMGEELGFLGVIIVLTLYSIMLYMMFRILGRTNDRFGELIIIGVMGMLFFQIIVNIGMNIGVMPITGITLPLLSYGGSSLLTVLASLGLVASVARFGTKKHRPGDLEI